MAKKFMISIDESLMEEIEGYASKMYLSRSAAISVLCSTALQAQNGMKTLEKLLQAYEVESAKQQLHELAGTGEGA